MRVSALAVVTRSRRKPQQRLCRPTSPLGRSDRLLALLLSFLFALFSRFFVAWPPAQGLLLSAKYLFGATRGGRRAALPASTNRGLSCVRRGPNGVGA